MQPPETLTRSASAQTPQAPGTTSRTRAVLDALRSDAVIFPLLVFVLTRVALLGFAQLGLMLIPDLWWNPGNPTLVPAWPALDALCRWDCRHFERLTIEGYRQAADTNFFPLLPLLARALSAVTFMPRGVALLVVPNLAALGALIVIYRIFADLEGTSAARWGVALFVAYPFAFFQATGYPESLMIFWSALAIWLALRGSHVWAGVALGVGILARHLTMFAGASLLAAQLRERGVHPRRFLLSWSILGLVMPWVFLGGYMLYQFLAFGDALAFWHARANWGERAWWGILQLAQTSDTDVDVRAMWSYVPLALAPTVGAIALATRKRWLELAAFGLVFMTMLWTVGSWGLGRYSASCWPAFLPLGVWLARRPRLQSAVIAVLALFQGLFFYLFIHQFPIL